MMLSEGTLLSGGEKDRKIVAWDSLQNYKKITETKVNKLNLNEHLNRRMICKNCIDHVEMHRISKYLRLLFLGLIET